MRQRSSRLATAGDIAGRGDSAPQYPVRPLDLHTTRIMPVDMDSTRGAAATAAAEHADVDGAALPPPVSTPARREDMTPAWVRSLSERLLWGTRARKASEFASDVLSFETVMFVLDAAHELLKREPTVVDVAVADGRAAEEAPARVVVVGDTHGQFHDVLRIFEMAPGQPSSTDTHFIFNGDFIDRGSWGLENIILLLAWKCAAPARVTLVRGNHETKYCSMMYGFKSELEHKFGMAMGSFDKPKGVWLKTLRIFASLPLAAVVAGSVLVLHGGMFRAPKAASAKAAGGGKQKGKKGARGPQHSEWVEPEPGDRLEGEQVGSLQHLRDAGKGGMDPPPDFMQTAKANSRLAADALWSDPGHVAGFVASERGIGTVHGPDVLQDFVAASPGVRLVVRSHEGPDSRDAESAPDRAQHFGSLDEGFSVDHEIEDQHGKASLVTVFSAPCYPQHEATSDNKGSFLVLNAPNYHENYSVVTFAAAPRPPSMCYYALDDDGDMATTEPIGGNGAAMCNGDEGGEYVGQLSVR